MRGSRTTLALAIGALTAAACVANPDPRHVSVQNAERESLGGWAVVTDVDGRETQGELIAVEPSAIRVLARAGRDTPPAPSDSAIPGAPSPQAVHEYSASLVVIPRARVRTMQLYRYGNDHFGAWGTLGGLSTISHLVLAAITLPVWIAVTTSAENSETKATILAYPGHTFEEMAMWARFPQGMPRDLPPEALYPRGPAPGAPLQTAP